MNSKLDHILNSVVVVKMFKGDISSVLDSTGEKYPVQFDGLQPVLKLKNSAINVNHVIRQFVLHFKCW